MEFYFKTDPVWVKKDVVGLDIGSNFIKIVQLAKNKKLTKLVGYGKIPVPENSIVEGVIAEPEKLAAAIKGMIETNIWGQITAKRVNTSLPESKIFTRILTLPRMKEKDLEEAISWEASQSIPMALTDLYLDWKIIGPSQVDPKSNEIIFAAAPKAIVNSYLQLFQCLEWEPMAIETSLNAITRAMIPARNKNETILVIDIGGNTTNMAIFDQVIRVTGSSLVGGDMITSKVAAATESDPKGKKSIEKKKEIREIVDEDITLITREAEKIIRYYYEKINKTNAISKILLCGGNAVIPNLTDIFKEKTGIETFIGNPWANISIYPIKPVPKNEAPIYTNAVGLALLGVKDD
jgi:type IV pilus assembly protein PilM